MDKGTRKTADKAEQKANRARKQIEKEVEELYLDQRRRAQARALWYMYRHGELSLQNLKMPTGLGYHEQVFLYSHPSKYNSDDKDRQK